jgi:hypothetical protein
MPPTHKAALKRFIVDSGHILNYSIGYCELTRPSVSETAKSRNGVVTMGRCNTRLKSIGRSLETQISWTLI